MKKTMITLALLSMGLSLQAVKKEMAGEKEHRTEVAAAYEPCKRYVPADNEARLHHLLVEIGEFSSWDLMRLAANEEDGNRLWACVTKAQRG